MPPIFVTDLTDIERAKLVAQIKADTDAGLAEMRLEMNRQLFAGPVYATIARTSSPWALRYLRLVGYLRGWQLAARTLWLALRGQTWKLDPDDDDY